AETIGSDATDDEVRAALAAELVEWQQWAQGEVYGVTVKDQTGAVVDSCWGMYGFDYAHEEAERMLKEAAPNDQKRRASTLEALDAGEYGPVETMGRPKAGELPRWVAVSSRNC